MIKLIASILMVIDHTAVALLPPLTNGITATLICRLIGRLAMPIFAYQLAQGFARTKNFDKYLQRIVAMTIAAQIPYYLLLTPIPLETLLDGTIKIELLNTINIGWTFTLALILLRITTQIANPLIKIATWIIVYLLAPYGDYGFYGIMTVVTFYLAHERKFSPTTTTLLLAALTLFFYRQYPIFYSLIQLTSIGAVWLIYNVPNKQIKLGRWFFYIFYPTHMLILVIIRQILYYIN